jgi:DNA topoisomerase-3
VAIRSFDTRTEQTKPPDYLQESELISLMDEHGIGTDASIPQHIKNVCERHYVDVCGPTGENGERGQVIAGHSVHHNSYWRIW